MVNSYYFALATIAQNHTENQSISSEFFWQATRRVVVILMTFMFNIVKCDAMSSVFSGKKSEKEEQERVG